LWLDDNHDNPNFGNPKIRCSIPGYKGCKELKPCENGQIPVESNNAGISLEDQVDMFLFTSCAAILDFLNHEQQRKFIKYPGSLFRIVSNQRLFVGGTDGVLRDTGLCKLIDENPIWQFVFPAIMVFNGDNQAGLLELNDRPNITCTCNAEDCMSFVTFGAVMSLASGGDGMTS
jgi:hypothetical protein